MRAPFIFREMHAWWLPFLTFMVLIAEQRVFAGDWPQILGPKRNGVAVGEKLADTWPASGPPLLWEAPIGSGYAGPAVAGNTVVMFHRRGDQERLTSRDVVTGNLIWQTEFDVSYRCNMNDDSGPRCVPIIHGKRVIAFGAGGNLYCVDLTTGKQKWTRDLYDDYQSDYGYFGAGSTPVVVGDRIVVNVGGSHQAGIVGLDVDHGKTVWSVTNEKASYSSPVPILLDGKQLVFVLTRLQLLLIDPKTGNIHDQVDFGKLGPTVNAAMPLVFDSHVFLTASYRIGALLAKCHDQKLQEVWRTDDAISSQYNSCIYTDGHIFGIHGREDTGIAHLRCIEGKTGNVRWNQSNFGVSHLILADNGILALTADGELIILDTDTRSYQERSRAQIFEQTTTRALPALSNGRFFVRNNKVERSQMRVFQVGG